MLDAILLFLLTIFLLPTKNPDDPNVLVCVLCQKDPTGRLLTYKPCFRRISPCIGCRLARCLCEFFQTWPGCAGSQQKRIRNSLGLQLEPTAKTGSSVFNRLLVFAGCCGVLWGSLPVLAELCPPHAAAASRRRGLHTSVDITRRYCVMIGITKAFQVGFA